MTQKKIILIILPLMAAAILLGSIIFLWELSDLELDNVSRDFVFFGFVFLGFVLPAIFASLFHCWFLIFFMRTVKFRVVIPVLISHVFLVIPVVLLIFWYFLSKPDFSESEYALLRLFASPEFVVLSGVGAVIFVSERLFSSKLYSEYVDLSPVYRKVVMCSLTLGSIWFVAVAVIGVAFSQIS